MKKSYPGLRNISDSSNVEISQPKLPGNQKHSRKLEEKINKLGKKAERIMIKPTTVSRIPEVGIRKLEDKSFRKSMLPQKRGSNQKIVFHEKNNGLSGSRQAISVQKHEYKNKTVAETRNCVQEVLSIQIKRRTKIKKSIKIMRNTKI